MYLLNNDKLKDRSSLITWLFFNKQLKKDCKESINILVEDIDKVDRVEKRAYEIKDIDSELQLAVLKKGMTELYLKCVECAYTPKKRIPLSYISELVIILRALDKTLDE
jgi:hypothetical protein|nr:MAG TPA: hypothetical protein [Caudoviricetes sp.]